MGDFRAQIAAIKTGERRILRAPRSNTAATRCWQHRRDHATTARRSRARRSAHIPDGVYEAESFMDDDGVRLGPHIPIQRPGHRGRRAR